HRLPTRRSSDLFGQGRQEASECLARPRWRYQQCGLPCLAARKKFKLMRARRPALPREPFYEWLRQAGRKFRFGRARFGGHAPQVARTGRSAKRKQNKKIGRASCRARVEVPEAWQYFS